MDDIGDIIKGMMFIGLFVSQHHPWRALRNLFTLDHIASGHITLGHITLGHITLDKIVKCFEPGMSGQRSVGYLSRLRVSEASPSSSRVSLRNSCGRRDIRDVAS